MKLLKLVLLFLTVSYAASAAVPILGKQKATVQIFKNTLEIINDNFSFETTLVCEKQIILNVMDARSNTGPIYFSKVLCPSNFDNLPVEVHLDSLVLVSKPLYGAGNPADQLFYNLHLQVMSQPNSVIHSGLGLTNSASTRNLDLENLNLHMSANQRFECNGQVGSSHTFSATQVRNLKNKNASPYGNCRIVNPVAFSANVEFESVK